MILNVKTLLYIYMNVVSLFIYNLVGCPLRHWPIGNKNLVKTSSFLSFCISGLQENCKIHCKIVICTWKCSQSFDTFLEGWSHHESFQRNNWRRQISFSSYIGRTQQNKKCVKWNSKSFLPISAGEKRNGSSYSKLIVSI